MTLVMSVMISLATPLGEYMQEVAQNITDAFITVGNKATSEEVDAAFKWLELIGGIPTNSEDTKAAWAETAKTQSEQGRLVGYGTINIFADEKLTKAKEEAEKPYITVNPKMFADYQGLEGVTVNPEPPVCAQELYAVFDRILQQILTNKDADIKGILSKEAAEFQTKYLDKQ